MASVSLRQVEAFKAVVEHGIVSRAAQALGVSQPALSKLIATLEQDSGLALFDRRKGRLIPTARGLRFYAEVDRIFIGMDQLQRAIEELREDQSETLRIGVIPALSGRLLQETVARYHALRPQTRLSIYVRESQFLSDWIEHGKLDLLIASWATDIHGLVEAPLIQAPVVCLMAPDHPLAAHATITPELLANQRFVTLTEDSFLPTRLKEICTQHGVALDIAAEVSVAGPLCRLVASGLGVSLLHPLVVADADMELVTRPFLPALPVNFHIYRTPSSVGQAPADGFITCLQEAAAGLLAAPGGAAV